MRCSKTRPNGLRCSAMRRLRAACWAVAAATLAAAGCVQRPDLKGPMPVRNQHPAQLLVMHLDPVGADVLPAGRTAWRTDVAYTSLFLVGRDPGSAWVMDGELMRTALDAKLGLGAGLQLGLQVPTAHTSGGFLDSFIKDYHDAFGFPDQDRSSNPDDQWLVEASRGGQAVWSMQESSAELLDVPVHLAWQLREPGEDRLGLVLRGGFELPTGDQDKGYGNGGVDWAVGAALEYRNRGVGYSLTAQHTFAATPRPSRTAGLRLQGVTSAAFGAELPITDTLHALVQTEWETSTLRDLGVRAAARQQLMLWVGGRWSLSPEWSLELGFGEDLIELASPDFTGWISMQWRPGVGSVFGS